MPYELITKTIVEESPCPCGYCNIGWAAYSTNTRKSCTDTCERYKDWREGKIVIPEGFDEVREIKGG